MKSFEGLGRNKVMYNRISILGNAEGLRHRLHKHKVLSLSSRLNFDNDMLETLGSGIFLEILMPLSQRFQLCCHIILDFPEILS